MRARDERSPQRRRSTVAWHTAAGRETRVRDAKRALQRRGPQHEHAVQTQTASGKIGVSQKQLLPSPRALLVERAYNRTTACRPALLFTHSPRAACLPRASPPRVNLAPASRRPHCLPTFCASAASSEARPDSEIIAACAASVSPSLLPLTWGGSGKSGQESRVGRLSSCIPVEWWL